MIKFEGLKATSALMRRTAEKTSQHARRAGERGAKNVVALAKSYAPLDEGDLENAIKYEESRDGRRIVWTMGVDESALQYKPFEVGGERYEGYHVFMHEGDYDLGELSAGKGTHVREGGDIGPGYITRAIEDAYPDIIDDMERGA